LELVRKRRVDNRDVGASLAFQPRPYDHRYHYAADMDFILEHRKLYRFLTMNTQSHLAAKDGGSFGKMIDLAWLVTVVAIAIFAPCDRELTADTVTPSQDHITRNGLGSPVLGPVYRGLQLSVNPLRKVFPLGDPIRVAVVTTNLTTDPIGLTVIFLDPDQRYDMKFVVTDAHGQRVPFTQLGSILDGMPSAVSGNAGGRFISPKGTIEDVIRLNDRFDLGTTGVFYVTVRRLVPGDNNKLVPDLISNTAKFEIVPAGKDPGPR
jgi:hypothetical protein